MMREIKFRVWDKANKNMIIPSSLHFVCGQLDIVRIEERSGVSEDGVIFKKLIPINNYELMQYTGLKDKNGKEIYEGDIVRRDTKSEGYKPEYSEKQNEIVWNNKLGRFELKDHWYSAGLIYKGYEVIGNIYETPELLNEKG